MPLQFQPVVLGLMLVVAVGTAVYALWSGGNTQRGQAYSYSEERPFPSDVYQPPDNRPSLENTQKRRSRKAYSDGKCSICISPIGNSLRKTLTCGHSFHHHCIQMWLNNNTTCPNCRTNVAAQ